MLDELNKFLNAVGEEAIITLSNTFKRKRHDDFLISKILCFLGKIDNKIALDTRFRLLVEMLNSGLVLIRDGALLGLSYLDDIKSIPYIKTAIKNENIQILRTDMKELLLQLENTKSELSTKTS